MQNTLFFFPQKDHSILPVLTPERLGTLTLPSHEHNTPTLPPEHNTLTLPPMLTTPVSHDTRTLPLDRHSIPKLPPENQSTPVLLCEGFSNTTLFPEGRSTPDLPHEGESTLIFPPEGQNTPTFVQEYNASSFSHWFHCLLDANVRIKKKKKKKTVRVWHFRFIGLST